MDLFAQLMQDTSLGTVLAILVAVVTLTAFFLRAEGRITSAFTRVNTEFMRQTNLMHKGFDDQNSLLLTALKDIQGQNRDAFTAISNRAEQAVRLQQEVGAALGKVGDTLSECDRRSSVEHAQIVGSLNGLNEKVGAITPTECKWKGK